jgi:hypothetical protein
MINTPWAEGLYVAPTTRFVGVKYGEEGGTVPHPQRVSIIVRFGPFFLRLYIYA